MKNFAETLDQQCDAAYSGDMNTTTGPAVNSPLRATWTATIEKSRRFNRRAIFNAAQGFDRTGRKQAAGTVEFHS